MAWITDHLKIGQISMTWFPHCWLSTFYLQFREWSSLFWQPCNRTHAFPFPFRLFIFLTKFSDEIFSLRNRKFFQTFKSLTLSLRHRSSGPNTGSNSEGRRTIKKMFPYSNGRISDPHYTFNHLKTRLVQYSDPDLTLNPLCSAHRFRKITYRNKFCPTGLKMSKIVTQNLRYVFENVRKRDPASSSIFQGGVETGSMYVQYVQGI